jgi:malonyl-CoA decarboxylase
MWGLLAESQGVATTSGRKTSTGEQETPRLSSEIAVGLRETVRVPIGTVRKLWECFYETQSQSETQQIHFFRLLCEPRPDVAKVGDAIKKLASTLHKLEKRTNDGVSSVNHTESLALHMMFVEANELRRSTTPVYALWLQQSVTLPQGMHHLLRMRRSLMHLKTYLRRPSDVSGSRGDGYVGEADAADLVRLIDTIDDTLSILFKEFFAKEFLVMEELTWTHTPPQLLQRVVDAESVHPFERGLLDMQSRVAPTPCRHLFAFFHPSVFEEPLIAVQVAHTSGIESSVDRVLGRTTPLDGPSTHKNSNLTTTQGPAAIPGADEIGCRDHNDLLESEADTAVFYSINSAQEALRGVELGNTLIKRVVHEVEHNINGRRVAQGRKPITTFTTLSPIPGYCVWLRSEFAKMEDGRPHCIFGQWGSDDVRQRQERYYFGELDRAFHGCGKLLEKELVFNLIALLDDVDHPRDRLWFWDGELTSALRLPLMRSVAWYLTGVKKRHRVFDPVGNFHVSNGAVVHRLNFLANCSAKGSQESGCVMVNYLYDPKQSSDNAMRYDAFQTVSVGEMVQGLLQDR